MSHHGIDAGLALPPGAALPEAPDAALDAALDALDGALEAAVSAALLAAGAALLLDVPLSELLPHAVSTSAMALTPTMVAVNFFAGL
ncbi:hypothetical protein ACVBEQ_05995 [Nakamurella sp. GG22]